MLYRDRVQSSSNIINGLSGKHTSRICLHMNDNVIPQCVWLAIKITMSSFLFHTATKLARIGDKYRMRGSREGSSGLGKFLLL